MRLTGNFWLIFGLIMAAGCAPVISTSLQQEAGAGPPVSFAELTANPAKYQGQLEILGGEVMEVTPWNNGSLLTVDQRQLDDKLFPTGTTSGGTFVVESDQWLNSNEYLPKSKVVVAGVVAGEKNGRLVLKARQVKVVALPTWEKYYYPVPREWYPPGMEYWYTPPYFDPYRGGGRH